MEKKTYIKPQISLVSYKDIMEAEFSNSPSNSDSALIRKSDDVWDDDNTSVRAGRSGGKSVGNRMWDDDAAEIE